jgi:hypothetical protein
MTKIWQDIENLGEIMRGIAFQEKLSSPDRIGKANFE